MNIRVSIIPPVTPVSMSILGLLLIIVAAACSDPGELTVQLLEVVPPAELEQLDQAVRAQFNTRWQQLQKLTSTSPVDTTQLGVAWGALGQWFDVYKYRDSAADCYRNARQLAPQEPRWPYYLALQAVDAGDLAAAQAGFEAAAVLAPAVPAPQVQLGDLALRQQQIDSAEAYYQEVLARNPHDPAALLGTGRINLLRGNPAAALSTLEAVATQQEHASEVHYLLGLTWRQLGNGKRAAEYLQRVPEENSDQLPLRRDDPWLLELQLLDISAASLTRRGLRAYRDGNYAEAAALTGRALGSDPDNIELWINYAAALHKAGRPAAAIEQLKAALQRDPQHARAQMVLGSVYLDRGRPAAAEPYFVSTLRTDPQLAEARLQLGRAYHQQGELERALVQYALVRNLNRSLADTRFWYAALLIVLDRFDAAYAALAEDRRMLPDERKLLLLQARLLAAAGDASIRDADRAADLLAADTATPDVLFAETAAMVAAGQGRFAAAVAWQRAAVDALDATRPRSAAHIARRRLVLYERGEACRSPWQQKEIPVFKPVLPPEVSG